METLPSEIVSAVARQGGYALAAAVISLMLYSQREKIGTAIQAHATSRQWRAVESANGKLVDALGKAMGPVMESAIDKRFREMPEFMREKIEGVVADEIRGISNELVAQGKRQDRMEDQLSDVARMVSRIEGMMEADK